MTALAYGVNFLQYYEMLIEQEKVNWDHLDKIQRNLAGYSETKDIELDIAIERAEVERRGTHVMRQMRHYLVPQIRSAGLRGIDWLCSEEVVNGDGAWGRTAGRDSRVLNTLEACTALSAWQQLYANQQNPPLVIRSIADRRLDALEWTVKQQNLDGAFIGLTHGVAAVHDTAIAVWLVCTFPGIYQADSIIDWNVIISKAVSWLHDTRINLKGHKLFRSYRFFGEDESSASRIFASIWALRAFIAYIGSPFASEQSPWKVDDLEGEILNFLEAARLSTHHRPEWQFLMGHKVTEKRPSPAIIGMLLTMLAEARAAQIPLSLHKIEQYIVPGIDYLFSTLGEQEPNLWDEEIEAYEQFINRDGKSTVRAWQHLATPWCIQALTQYNQYLDLKRRLSLIQSAMALLALQSDEGYFRLLHGSEAERDRSVFATAQCLYALAHFLKFVEELPLMEGNNQSTSQA